MCHHLWLTYYGHTLQHLPLYLCFDPYLCSRHTQTQNSQLICKDGKILQNYSAQTNSVTDQMTPCSANVPTYCMYVVQHYLSLLSVLSPETKPPIIAESPGRLEKTDRRLILRRQIKRDEGPVR